MQFKFSRSTRHWALLGLLLLTWGNSRFLQGQDDTPWTASLGGGVSTPVGRTADFAHSSGAFTAGVGYRLGGSQTVLLQYFATGLPFNREPRDQLSFLDPRSDVYSVTANFKLDLRRSVDIRPYVIGGGGWYRRVATITRPSVLGEIVCSGWLAWWNYGCLVGTVPLDKVVAASNSDALGFNAGVGLSGRIRKATPRWYIEIRYHHAPHQGVPTQTLPHMIGLTW